MKLLKVITIMLLTAKIGMAQNDVKIYNTMSFFYIDNSSGGTAPGLNQEVLNYLKLKVNEQERLKDNYVCTFTVDSANSILADNVVKTVSFDHLAKYLSASSATADYARDNESLQGSFKQNPVSIKDAITVYIFLSSKAVNQMIEEIDLMPTPVSFPYQLPTYTLHEKVLHPNIYLITNKDVLGKYTEAHILRCFTLYQNKAAAAVNPVPVLMFK